MYRKSAFLYMMPEEAIAYEYQSIVPGPIRLCDIGVGRYPPIPTRPTDKQRGYEILYQGTRYVYAGLGSARLASDDSGAGDSRDGGSGIGSIGEVAGAEP